MIYDEPKFLAGGDRYMLIEFGNEMNLELNFMAQGLASAIEQNITTLRNRVNELGVSEPIVARQGVDRIVVQLPGVQDPNQAVRVLGATATVEFRLVDEANNPYEAESSKRVPCVERAQHTVEREQTRGHHQVRADRDGHAALAQGDEHRAEVTIGHVVMGGGGGEPIMC